MEYNMGRKAQLTKRGMTTIATHLVYTAYVRSVTVPAQCPPNARHSARHSARLSARLIFVGDF